MGALHLNLDLVPRSRGRNQECHPEGIYLALGTSYEKSAGLLDSLRPGLQSQESRETRSTISPKSWRAMAKLPTVGAWLAAPDALAWWIDVDVRALPETRHKTFNPGNDKFRFSEVETPLYLLPAMEFAFSCASGKTVVLTD